MRLFGAIIVSFIFYFFSSAIALLAMQLDVLTDPPPIPSQRSLSPISRIPTPDFKDHPNPQEKKEYKEFQAKYHHDENPISALLSIAYSNNPLICHPSNIAYILQNHLAINSGSPQNPEYSALMIACDAGNVTLARILIDLGANKNHVMAGEVTPLTQALAKMKIPCAQLLVERGADVNFAPPYSKAPPLFWACWIGNAEMVQLLFSRGARLDLIKDVEIKQGVKKITFKDADDLANHLVDQGKDFHPIAKILIQHGAKVRKKNKAVLFIRNLSEKSK